MTDIAKLRAQISAGQYRVDATTLASALLDHANVDPPAVPAQRPAPDQARRPDRP